jgi:hypothetical protein
VGKLGRQVAGGPIEVDVQIHWSILLGIIWSFSTYQAVS